MSKKLNKCPDCGAPIPDGAPRGLCPKCLLKGAATPTDAGTTATPGAQPPTPPAPEKLSAAFPQLEVIELIGQGGMGYVYKARQPKLDRLVALKVLPETFAHDSAFTERFTREGRLLARLNHPNIISIFDFGVVESPDPSKPRDLFYLIMEFVDGVNLRQAMAAGKFTAEQALNVVPKICDALQYAHDEGVLHRDIKPENILLDTRGRVKIADFGVAKLIQDTQSEPNLTASGYALGTRNYMAPEQIEQPSTVDHRADIYSLGVVFYELLTGELPIGRFSPPSSKTQVNQEVDDVVLQSLEKERARRQQSAAEVKTQVQTAAQNASTQRTKTEEIPASGSTNPSGLKQKKKLSPLAWVTIILALVILMPILILGGLAALGGLVAIWTAYDSPQQTSTQTTPQPPRPRIMPPREVELSKNGHSIYAIHDDYQTVFVLYHHGEIELSVGEDNRIRDEAVLTLTNQTVFDVVRDFTTPDQLKLNDHLYNLQHGRTFILGRDGIVAQRRIDPPQMTDVGFTRLVSDIEKVQSELEQNLFGTWKIKGVPVDGLTTFTADHRFSSSISVFSKQFASAGTWILEGDTVTTTTETSNNKESIGDVEPAVIVTLNESTMVMRNKTKNGEDKLTTYEKLSGTP